MWSARTVDGAVAEPGEQLIDTMMYGLDRNTLLDHVWGDDYFGVDRVVDNHIKHLRRALGSAGSQIHTVIGRGYKLTEE